MAYTDSLISTGVDQLINLVYKSKRIKLEDASKKLGLAPKVIEEWARVLEDEKIIKIEYQLATAYLVWTGVIIEEPSGVTEAISERDSLINEVEGLLAKVNTLISESRAASKDLASVVRDISSVSEGVKKAIDTLSTIKNESAKSINDANRTIADIESLMRQAQNKISDYESILSEANKEFEKNLKHINLALEKHEQFKRDIDKQISMLEKSRDEIEEHLKELREMGAEIDKKSEQYRSIKEGKFKEDIEIAHRNFEEMRAKYTKLSESLSERFNEMKLALKTVEEFSKEVESLEEKISEDVIARRYAELKNIMDMLGGLEDEEERLDKKLHLLLKELKSIKIEVTPLSDEATIHKVEEAKDKIATAKRELTIVEQKRHELIELMKRIKGSK